MLVFISRVLNLKTAALLAVTLLAACSGISTTSKPAITDAAKFVEEAEKRYSDVIIKEGRASWVQSNFITHDTEALAAAA